MNELRRRLAEVVERPRADAPALATGVAALDAALPGGGLPLGRLTEVVGARGSGKTTLVRWMVERAVADGWWVAYVDAARTLAARDWAHVRGAGSLWVVRPRDAARGAWCADVLLRSGAFRLVVLDGVRVLSREVSVRLTRLARESDAAFVAMSDGTRAADLAGAVRLRVQPEQGSGCRGRPPAAASVQRAETVQGAGTVQRAGPLHPAPDPCTLPPAPSIRTLSVLIEKGAPYQRVDAGVIDRDSIVARRVRAHPEVPDRRGVHVERTGTTGRINARSRRCAEPRLGRASARAG